MSPIRDNWMQTFEAAEIHAIRIKMEFQRRVHPVVGWA